MRIVGVLFGQVLKKKGLFRLICESVFFCFFLLEGRRRMEPDALSFFEV